MKKFIVILTIAIAIAGCGRESEQMEADAARPENTSQTISLAWHKVNGEDGSVCELSLATQQMVDQASVELSQALAANNIEVAVQTLTPEKVEGGECLCNRVLVQDRFVDEWLGARLVKTACSGCPNQAKCAETAEPDGCGGQYEIIYQGENHRIVPSDLIVTAGIIAAADLTGEKIAYAASEGGSKVNCTCGKCEDGSKCADCEHRCEHHVAGAECSPDCPGAAAGATPPCQAALGKEPTASKTTAAPKKSGCPRAANCGNTGCPSKGSGS